jgi:hypothetical protein
MEDDAKGLKNKAPFAPDHRFALLSPTIESVHGPQTRFNPPLAGEVPADPHGFFSQGGTEEVPTNEFHSFPEGDLDRPTEMWKGHDFKK